METLKFIKMKNVFIMLCITLMSWGVSAQHEHPTHDNNSNEQMSEPVFNDKQMGSAYSHYNKLKNALVGSDYDKAKSASEDLVELLSNMKAAKKAEKEANEVANAKQLSGQRQAFANLSNEMISLVKNSKLQSGTVYVEYCPMANSGEGAQWLSNEQQINNPYFGDKMLRCGKVTETIKAMK